MLAVYLSNGCGKRAQSHRKMHVWDTLIDYMRIDEVEQQHDIRQGGFRDTRLWQQVEHLSENETAISSKSIVRNAFRKKSKNCKRETYTLSSIKMLALDKRRQNSRDEGGEMVLQ
jgi:hypothetical protein